MWRREARKEGGWTGVRIGVQDGGRNEGGRDREKGMK